MVSCESINYWNQRDKATKYDCNFPWNFLSFCHCRLNHRDLKPNIGLFWYFFTEMFEHFRTLFLITFQMNATILYSVPLTIKLHKLPVFLATILTALITIFRSYPCVGDVAFYLALFPLWKQSARCKSHDHNIVIFFFQLFRFFQWWRITLSCFVFSLSQLHWDQPFGIYG